MSGYGMRVHLFVVGSDAGLALGGGVRPPLSFFVGSPLPLGPLGTLLPPNEPEWAVLHLLWAVPVP